MLSFHRLLGLCCLLFLLTSCQEEPSYSYLMKHPLYTSKQAMHCDSMPNTQKKGPFCAKVLEAAQNIFAILKQQQLDPEGFGLVILETQISAAKIQQQIMVEKQKVLPGDQQQNQQKKILQLESLLRIQQEKIQILLAVVGMGHPE